MRLLNAVLAVGLLTLLLHSQSASRVPWFPGDEAFVRMEYSTAIQQYDSVLRVIVPHPDLFWRRARVHIAMGDVAEEKDRMAHYRIAVESAKQCIALDSSSAEGYAWLAAGLGSIAMDVGSRRKVELANEIKSCLDRAVALDPNNDVAWSILGTFYRSLGGVSWIERQLANLLLGSLPDGGYAESEKAFQRAVAIAPRIVRHRFELALLYEETDRIAQARSEYRQCTVLPIQMASDRKRQAEALKWLRENGELSQDKQ